MKASTLAASIEASHALRRTLLIEGPPGCGKTQVVEQVARKMDIGFIALHAPLLQPEDYGMPVVSERRDAIDFVVPSKFPLEGSNTPDEGVLLFDEMSQAGVSEQKIMANMIQARELHGKRLKPGWTIMATGNRQQDRAGANKVLSHLANRLTRVEFEPDLEDWIKWALTHGVRPEICAFLRFKPGLLSVFDPNANSSPTPRSWAEGVSPIIGNVPQQAELELFSGAVGQGAATEFMAFLKHARELPNMDLVFADPDGHPLPKETSAIFAFVGAMVHRATPDNFDVVMRIANRLPDEYGVLVVRDAYAKDPDIMSTKAFIDWATTKGRKVTMG